MRFAFAASCLLLCACGCAKPDPVALKQQLDAAIPQHATSLQVLAYLDREKIDHSQYLQLAGNPRSISATIRAPAKSSCTSSDSASVIFQFDDHDLLTRFDVRPGYTGP